MSRIGTRVTGWIPFTKKRFIRSFAALAAIFVRPVMPMHFTWSSFVRWEEKAPHLEHIRKEPADQMMCPEASSHGTLLRASWFLANLKHHLHQTPVGQSTGICCDTKSDGFARRLARFGMPSCVATS